MSYHDDVLFWLFPLWARINEFMAGKKNNKSTPHCDKSDSSQMFMATSLKF